MGPGILHIDFRERLRSSRFKTDLKKGVPTVLFMVY
jgi:hypothetical protein